MPDRPSHFHRHRFPAGVISYAVWLYYRFPLSHRDVEELLAERDIQVSYETVRRWAIKFGALCGGATTQGETTREDVALGRGILENEWPKSIPVEGCR